MNVFHKLWLNRRINKVCNFLDLAPQRENISYFSANNASQCDKVTRLRTSHHSFCVQSNQPVHQPKAASPTACHLPPSHRTDKPFLGFNQAPSNNKTGIVTHMHEQIGIRAHWGICKYQNAKKKQPSINYSKKCWCCCPLKCVERNRPLKEAEGRCEWRPAALCDWNCGRSPRWVLDY